MKTLAAALVITTAATSAAAFQHQRHDPAGHHGASVMGFSQTATSHHFRLSPKGGAIEVHAHDASKTELRETVAAHLRTIAGRFAKGDFTTPAAVHGAAPDGVDVLASHREKITYTFEEGALGGRVVIQTDDAAARDAVHAFLRYQIREHRTGDSLRVLE